MKVRIDQSRCATSGCCAMNAPEIFDQNEDDGTITVLIPVPGPELHAKAREAAQLCPTQAVIIEEA